MFPTPFNIRALVKLLRSGNVSEVVTDLASMILNSESWDAETLTSPVTSNLPPVENLPQQIPFEQALPMVVDPKTPTKGYCDVYIDDIATVTVDLPGHAK